MCTTHRRDAMRTEEERSSRAALASTFGGEDSLLFFGGQGAELAYALADGSEASADCISA